jgi:hypothetical protein
MSEEENRVILANVDRYRFAEPMSEGMRIILSYRGEPYSPAYVQGISGAAFRMAGICPCAPTCSEIMPPAQLARLIGYAAEEVPFEAGETGRTAEEILARVRAEIRAGRPVLLWHAFTSAEWDVVCGYDLAEAVFYGRGSYLGLEESQYARAADQRALTCLDICPALGAVFVGDKTGHFDAWQAEIEALREAVRHARAEKPESETGAGWTMLTGMQCYRRWAREFEEDAGRGRTAGDSYCLGVYRSTRRAAAAFLRELTYKVERAGVELRRGQQAFEREAEMLDRCAGFLGWDTPEAPDPQRNQRVAVLLAQAAEAYEDGIEAVEKALSKM